MRKTISICCLLVLSGWCSSFTPPVWCETARDKFLKADAAYRQLRNDVQKQKYRHHWLECIRLYQDVYRHDPHGPWAAAGMFRSAELYRDLHRFSGRPADLKEALDAFERVLHRYPESAYQGRAADALSRIQPPSAPPVKKRVSKIDDGQEETAPVAPTAPPPDARSTNDPSPDSIQGLIAHARETVGGPEASGPMPVAGPSVVTNLRHWSNPSYTRVVIDVDNEATYSYRLLNQDPAIAAPPRLYVDIENSRLGGDTSKIVPIHDNLLENIRTGQFTAEQVRVVIDIKSFKTYKIFSLNNPFRIVVDVWGSDSPSIGAPETSAASAKRPSKDGRPSPGAIARQLALGVRTIVIDPGHGGRDFGAPGYLKGVHEKTVILDIARKLAQKIEKELKCRVVLTRDSDRFLTLEERTAIANTNNADLFISLHTNAHRDPKAKGIETYFLNLTTDEDSIRVAAMENATSTKNISDLQTILLDLMQNAKINESSRLAAHVQGAVASRLKHHYDIIDKGVKQAPFYVLLGAQMPAILIETGFISNPVECRRLVSPEYQDRLCDAIVNGIRAYIKETNPSAFTRRYEEADSRGG